MSLFGGVISISNISTLLVVVFAVLMFGYLLGRITIKGISLGDAGVFIIARGNILAGAASEAAGLVCAGLAILGFFICKLVSRGMVQLTKKMLLGIKRMFVGKEKRA